MLATERERERVRGDALALGGKACGERGFLALSSSFARDDMPGWLPPLPGGHRLRPDEHVKVLLNELSQAAAVFAACHSSAWCCERAGAQHRRAVRFTVPQPSRPRGGVALASRAPALIGFVRFSVDPDPI